MLFGARSHYPEQNFWTVTPQLGFILLKRQIFPSTLPFFSWRYRISIRCPNVYTDTRICKTVVHEFPQQYLNFHNHSPISIKNTVQFYFRNLRKYDIPILLHPFRPILIHPFRCKSKFLAISCYAIGPVKIDLKPEVTGPKQPLPAQSGSAPIQIWSLLLSGWAAPPCPILCPAQLPLSDDIVSIIWIRQLN